MQNDIASQLIDDDGQLKSFDKWLQDIKGMTTHYVGPWLRTEYNTAVLRAHQAADWKHFEQEQDVFQNLRWMPTTSPEQDPLHRQYWEKKLTLPINHPFWEKHRPGDRWNCKCSLAQTDEPANDEVIRDFYPVPQQPGLDNNPADEGKLFSDSHPYITKAYAGARKAVLKAVDAEPRSVIRKRRKTEAEKESIRIRWEERRKLRDAESRLTIQDNADQREIADNTRAAMSILKSFPKIKISIRQHVTQKGVKNPEYLIDGLIADRKGINSENGVASGFKSAIQQGCKAVVIDLDYSMHKLNERRLATHIQWRHADFENGTIEKCYVVFNDKAVVISKEDVLQKNVAEILKRLKP